MSEELCSKIVLLTNSLRNNKLPHQIIQFIIDTNKLIDLDFDNPIKNHDALETIEQLMSPFQEASLTNYSLAEQEVHKIRGSIISSLNSLVFITESKLLLLLNDEEWCDLDNYYRNNSQYFFKEDMFNKTLFEDNEVRFFNTHPLVQFSMTQCKVSLFDILLSNKQYSTVDDLDFLKTLFTQVRNRLAVISNYAHSQDVNDIDEYVVQINNNRAIPTSRFIYDFAMLTKEVERNFRTFELAQPIKQSGADYENYLSQVRPAFLKWAANMTVTAAGDDFCAIFGKYYCEVQVRYFEELLYRRKFPAVNIIYYKLLQTTRGMTTANQLMQTGNDFVVDLLKRDLPDDEDADELDLDDPDGMADELVVLERMEKLSATDLNGLMMGICDYVTSRQWKRTIKSLFTMQPFPDVSLEPKLLSIPFSHSIVLFTKTQDPVRFLTFMDAFAAWCYHLQRDYDGTLYDKKTSEKTVCTPQLKKMFAL